MDFSLSAEQSALQDSVRKFCKEQYSFKQRQTVARESHGFSRVHWNLFAELGWLGAGLPEDCGGFGCCRRVLHHRGGVRASAAGPRTLCCECHGPRTSHPENRWHHGVPTNG